MNVVYTNIAAINANKNLSRINTKNQAASQKLSSGLRINSAADDAAGLAISEKMRSQIRGLEKAERNVEDAKSLFTTGDGALNEINSMLIRIRELAIQSANDTNTDSDRQVLDAECQQLLGALDGIVDSTEFNTQKILKSGVKTTQTIEHTESVVLKNLFMSSLSINDVGSTNMGAGSNITQITTTQRDSSQFYISNAANNASIKLINFDFGTAMDDAYNSIKGSGPSTLDTFIDQMYATPPPSDEDKETLRATVEAAFNTVYAGNGVNVVAAYDGSGRLGVGFLNREDIKIAFGGCSPASQFSWGHGFVHGMFSSTANTADVTITTTVTETIETWPEKEIWVQSGANELQGDLFKWNTVSVDELELSDTKLTPFEEAIKALGQLDNAMEYIAQIRMTFGAYMNRLDFSANSATVSHENLSASESRIRDADMAKEMMEYTKTNVLQQAGIAMLTQANQAPQTVLQLIKS